MKLFNSCTAIQIAITLTLLGGSSQAFAGDGGSAGPGGGAGVQKPDGFHTIYSGGGHYQEPKHTTSQVPDDIPIERPSEIPAGLNELKDYVASLTFLEPETRQNLLRAIAPSKTRKYFLSIYPKDLTSTVVGRLLAQFQEATGISVDILRLYGVTDTNAKIYGVPAEITYLLPKFSELETLHEKMAALFHESYRVLHPETTYREVVEIEKDFQAMLDVPNDNARILQFIKDLHPGLVADLDQEHPAELKDYGPNAGFREDMLARSEYVHMAIKSDLESGNLGIHLDKNGDFNETDLLGNYPQCVLNGNYSGANCYVELMTFLSEKHRNYPNSLFIDYVLGLAKQSSDYPVIKIFKGLEATWTGDGNLFWRDKLGLGIPSDAQWDNNPSTFKKSLKLHLSSDIRQPAFTYRKSKGFFQ